MVVRALWLLLVPYRLLNRSSGRISTMHMQPARLIGVSTRIRGQAILCHFAMGVGLLLLMLVTLGVAGRAQNMQEMPPGIAWQVRGLWRADGNAIPIHTGDTIKPGSLLRPVAGSAEHSITILLPDGQRILYECYQAGDCARGFRVPLLNRKPDSQAVTMLWRIHAVLVKSSQEPRTGGDQMMLPHDETVAMTDAHARVEVAGLVAALPDGLYTYTERAIGQIDAHPTRKTFEKKAKSVAGNSFAGTVRRDYCRSPESTSYRSHDRRSDRSNRQEVTSCV